MTPAEHRAKAEELLHQAGTTESVAEETYCITKAQAHATLALAPAPPPTQQQPKWDLTKPQMFPDATGGFLTLTPVLDGLIFNFEDTALLMEHPAVLRTIASHLTAHADRLESRP